ncbi:MAG: alpha/beta hydrolase [Solobacterium sp.]|nr:alpha/beta hydrolase [Solobacterium sp.]
MTESITRNPLYEGFTDGYFTTNDNVKLHYLVKGEGRPLIFVPGWSGDSRDYMFVAPGFAQNSRVYVLDMRGHGYSEAPDHGWRIARLSKDLQEFIESLGVDQIDLCGYSMGCTVCWSYIDLFGQGRIHKLILVDEPAMLGSNPLDTDEEMDLYGGNRMDSWDFRNKCANNDGFGDLFRTRFARGHWDVKDENALAVKDAVPAPVFQRAFLAELIRDHINQDWRDVIRRITIPTIFVNGEISHAAQEPCAAWIASVIPGCRRLTVTAEEKGTHELMLNAPLKFIQGVSAFLYED